MFRGGRGEEGGDAGWWTKRDGEGEGGEGSNTMTLVTMVMMMAVQYG